MAMLIVDSHYKQCYEHCLWQKDLVQTSIAGQSRHAIRSEINILNTYI